jgi:hypothetical protein
MDPGPDGTMSLRQAIIAVNGDNNPNGIADTIDFSELPDGIAVFRVGAAGPYPAITRTVNIDGWTKTDSQSNSLQDRDNAEIEVQLNNALVISSSNANGTTIRGLALPGVLVDNANACRIVGNFIGLDVTGQPFSGNGADPPSGVSIHADDQYGGNDNDIGGTMPAERNVISGADTGANVSILGGFQNRVYGNFIGTNRYGQFVSDTHSVGVQFLASATSGSHDNFVGSQADAGSGNVIAFNGYSAVMVSGASSTNNTIQSNSIFSNDQKRSQVFPPILFTLGGNKNQAAPQLISASENEVTVMGRVPSNTAFQFFANDYPFTNDPGGFAEGKTLLKLVSQPPQVDANGNSIFTFSQTVSDNSFITATATDANGNTSPFSNGILVKPSSGTTPPDDAFEIGQLTEILGTQGSLLKKLNGKKPPSKAVAQNVLNLELRYEAAVVILVNTVANPNDVTFRSDVSAFLKLDAEIEAKALAIVKMDTKAAVRAAASPRAKARLAKQLGKIEAEVKSALAQDKALAGELGLA